MFGVAGTLWRISRPLNAAGYCFMTCLECHASQYMRNDGIYNQRNSFLIRVNMPYCIQVSDIHGVQELQFSGKKTHYYGYFNAIP